MSRQTMKNISSIAMLIIGAFLADNSQAKFTGIGLMLFGLITIHEIYVRSRK